MKNYIKNWQTSLSGVALIALGVGQAAFGFQLPGFTMEPGAAIIMGIGLLQAKDGNVTGGSVAATVEAGKRVVVIALMCLLAFSITTSAVAADMPPPVLKARAQASPVTVVSWASGLYVGANVSGTKSAGDFTMVAAPGVGEARASGLMAGGTVGLGAWLGGLYVGAEVDGDYDFGKANVACGFAAVECKMRDGYLLTQRLLVGLTMPGAMSAQRAVSAPAQWPVAIDVPSSVSASVIMPYVTGGIAQRRTQACIEAIGCAKDWLVGWTAGGGIKIPMSQAVSLDIGYLYIGWNKHLNPASDAAVVFPAVDFKATSEHVLKAGLQFHL